jgi:hypothetical protein
MTRRRSLELDVEFVSHRIFLWFQDLETEPGRDCRRFEISFESYCVRVEEP